jgi:hypothetical protein
MCRLLIAEDPDGVLIGCRIVVHGYLLFGLRARPAAWN